MNIIIQIQNNTNSFINNINKIHDFYEEKKTNDLHIKNNKHDQSTQTERNPLYIEEEDTPITINEVKIKKKEKILQTL